MRLFSSCTARLLDARITPVRNGVVRVPVTVPAATRYGISPRTVRGVAPFPPDIAEP
jgi:hypothetical protein